jgi:ribosomal protein S18 acetylase RimI-like enzyme
LASSYVSLGEALDLSNRGQLELLRAAVRQGAALRITARGHSMAPFVRDADVLTIAPLDDRELSCGDVVAFAAAPGDRLVVHRVIGAAGGGWLVRGDNVRAADGIVAQASVLGRVVRVQRRGRDVGIGLTWGAGPVAALSRRGVLARVGQSARTARRAAAAVVAGAQSLPAYRSVARRLCAPCAIGAATPAEIEAAQRRLAPGGFVALAEAGPGVSAWVARHGGRVVGFAQRVERPVESAPWDGQWLVGLTVRAPYRGLGVGEALTRRVVAEARADGAGELRLAVFENDLRAVRLYEKLGFSRVTVPGLEQVFAEESVRYGRRRVVMRKELDGSGGTQ